MDRSEFEKFWGETLRSEPTSITAFDPVIDAVVDLARVDKDFRAHLKNRSKRVVETTGVDLAAERFDTDMAKAYVGDELGFKGMDELQQWLENQDERKPPLLFKYAVAALWRGDFTSIDRAMGHEQFASRIKDWFGKGFFNKEPGTFAEAFAAACWLGHVDTVAFLLDSGVDPYAGMRTGLSGFHWAASSGQFPVITLLIERQVSMEIKSMYDSTVLGQALWSATYEHSDRHADIVKALVEAGAHVWPGSWEWWQEQPVPSKKTKSAISDALRKYDPEAPI